MAYRVISFGQQTPSWSGGSSLASGTACLVRTANVTALEPAGAVSASVSGNNFTFKDAPGNTLSTVVMPAQTTLASVLPGATVWINSGIGGGWTRGVVISDGTVFQYGALGASTLPTGTPAYTGVTGASLPTPAASPVAGLSSTTSSYTLAGTASDGTPYFIDGNGNVLTASNSATTLGAVSAGTAAMVQVGTRWIYATV